MPPRATVRWLVLVVLVTAGCGLAGRAWAQAETASKVADAFLTHGEYGAIIVALGLVIVVVATVAGAVIRSLYNRLEALGERTIKALEDSAAGEERTREILQRLTDQLATRSQTLGDLSNLVSLNGTEIRHGFGNTSQALDGILRMLAEPKALARELAERVNRIWKGRGQTEDGE